MYNVTNLLGKAPLNCLNGLSITHHVRVPKLTTVHQAKRTFEKLAIIASGLNCGRLAE